MPDTIHPDPLDHGSAPADQTGEGCGCAAVALDADAHRPQPEGLTSGADAIAHAARYAWYEIDDTAWPYLSTLDPDLRCRFLKLGMLPGPRRFDLGTFRDSDGTHAAFEAIPALGDVNVTEVMDDPEGKAHEKAEDASPLQRFLQLSDKSTPVPHLLIDLDDESEDETTVRMLRGRMTTDVAEPIGAQVSDFEVPQSAPQQAAVFTCFTGGLNPFKDSYCPNWGIDFCDNGANHQVTRTSGGSKRKHSFSRIASCSGTTQSYHYYRAYWFGWKWFIASKPFEPNQQLIPANFVRSKHIKGGKKRRRMVKASRWTNNPGQYFRMYTSFH